jgi:hypothetical protein
MLFLLRALGRASNDRLMVYVTGGVIALWALSGLLVAAFQCPFPHAWAVLDSKCVNQVSSPRSIA